MVWCSIMVSILILCIVSIFRMFYRYNLPLVCCICYCCCCYCHVFFSSVHCVQLTGWACAKYLTRTLTNTNTSQYDIHSTSFNVIYVLCCLVLTTLTFCSLSTAFGISLPFVRQNPAPAFSHCVQWRTVHRNKFKHPKFIFVALH